MSTETTPMKWPAAWRDASALAFIKGTCINYLLMENSSATKAIAGLAKEAKIQVGETAPTGVSLVEGVWPGIQLTRSGKEGQADSGPTGEPWVNSNGWLISLEMAMHRRASVWVDAAPPAEEIPLSAYLIAMADSATYQGRWVLTLAPGFAREIAEGKPDAVNAWKKLISANDFFSAAKPWTQDLPMAIVGVISDFSGENESLTRELLNMLARANQQYRVIVKKEASSESLSGLKAIVYVDIEAPTAAVRTQMLNFVQAGGLLVTKAGWQPLPGDGAVKGDEHPRFSVGGLGKGRVAIAKEDPSDPYLLANDSVTLVSRRWDLLRFWNFGSIGSRLTVSADRRRATAQIVSYAEPGVYGPTVGVGGAYRKARLWRCDQPGSSEVKVARQKDGVEVLLPPLSIYGAVELEA